MAIIGMRTLAKVDSAFLKGGGHKIMDACCHLY